MKKHEKIVLFVISSILVLMGIACIATFSLRAYDYAQPGYDLTSQLIMIAICAAEVILVPLSLILFIKEYLSVGGCLLWFVTVAVCLCVIFAVAAMWILPAFGFYVIPPSQR